MVLPEHASNGGFPEPPADEDVRVVAARHDACGESTRVRLPGTLPTRAVRRFHCASCAAAFEAAQVEEIEVRLAAPALAEPAPVEAAPAPAPVAPAPEPIAPAPLPEPEAVIEAQPQAMESRAVEALTRAPRRKLAAPKLTAPKVTLPKLSLPKIDLPRIEPDSRTWRLLSIPLAALLVIAVLLMLRGEDDQQLPAAPPPEQAQPAGDAATGGPPPTDPEQAAEANGSKKTKFVRESTFSLALPEGWERVDPPAGANFAAVAADGGADATLWITQDPKLDFPTFISQSLAQLETLAGSARVVERVPAPTPEGTVVTLGADAPEGQPVYEVTLRVAGPYRYYLGTTTQPGASEEAADGVDLITGSLTPELEG